MKKLARYFSFMGRSSRLGFWRTQIPLLLILAVFWSAGFMLAESTGVDWLSALGLVAFVPVQWAGAALLFRRLHDRNKSAWWIVPFYVAPLMIVLAARAPLDQGAKAVVELLSLPALALLLWGYAEIGFMSGTRGKNRFGPDPRGAA